MARHYHSTQQLLGLISVHTWRRASHLCRHVRPLTIPPVPPPSSSSSSWHRPRRRNQQQQQQQQQQRSGQKRQRPSPPPSPMPATTGGGELSRGRAAAAAEDVAPVVNSRGGPLQGGKTPEREGLPGSEPSSTREPSPPAMINPKKAKKAISVYEKMVGETEGQHGGGGGVSSKNSDVKRRRVIMAEALQAYTATGQFEKALGVWRAGIPGLDDTDAPDDVMAMRATCQDAMARSCTELLRSRVEAREWSRAASIIDHLLTTGQRPSSSWNDAITVLLRTARLPSLTTFLDHDDLSLLPPLAMQSVVKKALSGLGRSMEPDAWSIAVDMINKLHARKLPLSSTCYQMAMDVCRKTMRPVEARQIMDLCPFPPEIGDFNLVAGAYSAVGDVDNVLSVVKEAEERGLKPDARTYWMVMKAYGVGKRKPEEAVALLMQAWPVLRGTGGWAVHRVLDRFVRVCVEAGERDLAMKVIDDLLPNGSGMKQRLQLECLMQGEISGEEALDILDQLCKAGFTPSGQAYKAAFKAVTTAEQRVRVLKDAEARGVHVPPYMLLPFLATLSRSGGYQEALEVLAIMERSGVPASRKAYIAVLTACGRAGKWREAEKLVESMNKQVEPDVVVYNTLLHGLARTGQWERALAMLYHMSSRGIRPDRVSFNTVMMACHNADQWETCLRLLRLEAPDSFTYAIAVKACLNASRVVEAVAIMAEMRSKGYDVNASSYRRAIELIANNPAVEGTTTLSLLDLFRAWQQLGGGVDGQQLRPGPRTYSYLFKWLARHKMWREACDLVEEMRVKGPPPPDTYVHTAIVMCAEAGQWNKVLDLSSRVAPDGDDHHHHDRARIWALREMLAAGRDDDALTILHELAASIDKDAGGGHDDVMGVQSGGGGGGLMMREKVFRTALRACRQAGKIGLVDVFAKESSLHQASGKVGGMARRQRAIAMEVIRELERAEGESSGGKEEEEEEGRLTSSSR